MPNLVLVCWKSSSFVILCDSHRQFNVYSSWQPGPAHFEEIVWFQLFIYVPESDFFLLWHTMATVYIGICEWQTLPSSVNYHTALQLELCCQKAGKDDEIPLCRSFDLLYQEDSKRERSKLVQRPEKKAILQVLQEDGSNLREEEDRMMLQSLNLSPALPLLPLANFPPPLAEMLETPEP